jgi:hypothetical protein
MYITESPAEIQTPNTPEHDWLQHDRPVASVIAQQYFFIILLSLLVSPRKEKYGAPFKNFTYLVS